MRTIVLGALVALLLSGCGRHDETASAVPTRAPIPAELFLVSSDEGRPHLQWVLRSVDATAGRIYLAVSFGACSSPVAAGARFDAEAVTITVLGTPPAGHLCTSELIVGFTSVQLDRPLGARKVLVAVSTPLGPTRTEESGST